MSFQESDPFRYIKGDGDWTIEKHQFLVPYHPSNIAEIDCVVGVCRDKDIVVGIIATIQRISSSYKVEEYEYAIRVILQEILMLHFFGEDEIEIPF